jgi:hypothetical protein
MWGMQVLQEHSPADPPWRSHARIAWPWGCFAECPEKAAPAPLPLQRMKSVRELSGDADHAPRAAHRERKSVPAPSSWASRQNRGRGRHAATSMGMRVRTHATLVFAPSSDLFAIVVETHACMIGCSAVVIRSICAGVVMLLSSRLKCTCCTPDTMYCQR